MFRDRWRQHRQLAMSLSMWRNMTMYRRFDVLTPGEKGLNETALAGMRTDAYGGVGSIGFRDEAALAAVLEDGEGVGTLQIDEVKTFGRELGTNLVPAHEVVVLPDTHGRARISLLAQLHRTPGTSRAAFSDGWREAGERIAGTPELAEHLAGCTQNHALPGTNE